MNRNSANETRKKRKVQVKVDQRRLTCLKPEQKQNGRVNEKEKRKEEGREERRKEGNREE